MLILHIFSCLVLGFISALWGWAEDVSLWGVLGSYALGGSLGVIASAMGVLLSTIVSPPVD